MRSPRIGARRARNMTADHGSTAGVRGSQPPPDEPPRGVEYPGDLECDIATNFDRPLHLRPVRGDDAARLVDFHARLSPDSIYRRYFSSHPLLSQQEVSHLTQVDYLDRLALVITDAEDIVAICRYERIPSTTTGEVAFVVRDDYQHRGLGHVMLEQLAKAAWSRGLTRFSGVTMRENRGMISIFEHSGFPVTVTHEGEEYYVSFSIDPAGRTAVDSQSHHTGEL